MIEKLQLEAALPEYRAYLEEMEMSRNTIRKYIGDVQRFLSTCGEPLDKNVVIAYKKQLEDNCKPNTVNSILRSLNRFFRWADCSDLAVKTEKVSPKTSLDNVLTLEEYQLLLETALRKGRKKLYLLLRTLASTGIRIGELHFITVEALQNKKNTIFHKGRYRELYLPESLCTLLLDFCERKSIFSGPVFRGRNDAPLESSGIWRSMKRLAITAGVEPAKVYPHSLRHLFARMYMERYGNIVALADILGHASIETTRRYTLSSADEKRMELEQLGL